MILLDNANNIDKKMLIKISINGKKIYQIKDLLITKKYIINS